MIRLSAAALFSLFVASAVLAQGSEKVLGKTANEWIDILKDHKEVKFRRASLIALEVYGGKTLGVLPAVTNALANDPEPQVRREAAMLLGRMSPESKGSLFALADAMTKDKAESVREAAAQALGGKLNEFAAPFVTSLADALNDPHPGTRTSAAEAILKLGDKAGPAVPSLMTLAKDPQKDRFSRQYAIKCLARLAPDNNDVATILIAALADKSAATPLRVEAADGLGRSTVAAAKVLPPLAAALGDPTVEVRRGAAAALAKQGKDAEIVWAKINDGLKDSDQAVRYQLIRLCGQLAKSMPEPVVALIDRAKKDANIENRVAAIQELGAVPVSDDVLAALTELQEDTNAAIRQAAEAAAKKSE